MNYELSGDSATHNLAPRVQALDSVDDFDESWTMYSLSAQWDLSIGSIKTKKWGIGIITWFFLAALLMISSGCFYLKIVFDLDYNSMIIDYVLYRNFALGSFNIAFLAASRFTWYRVGRHVWLGSHGCIHVSTTMRKRATLILVTVPVPCNGTPRIRRLPYSHCCTVVLLFSNVKFSTVLRKHFPYCTKIDWMTSRTVV